MMTEVLLLLVSELLTRTNPCNIINNVDDEMQTFVPCKKQCDSCTNSVCLQKVVLNFLLQKEFTKLNGLPHVFPKL